MELINTFLKARILRYVVLPGGNLRIRGQTLYASLEIHTIWNADIFVAVIG